MTDAHEQLALLAGELGLTLAFEYVPHDYPVIYRVKDMQRHWRVTVHKDGELILTTDYSEGIGYCDAYPEDGRLTARDSINIRRECERGPESGSPKQPFTALWLLADESRGVMQSASFEDWAGRFGLDTDSGEAEQTYRECVERYHRLNSAIGDDGIGRLASVELWPEAGADLTPEQ